MHRMALAGCVGLLLITSGCVPSPFDADWQKARPLGQDLPAYQPPHTRAPDEARSADELVSLTDEPLPLRRALAAALMHNPGLAGFAWEVRTAEARALQASLWPNPEAEVETEGIGQSSDSLGLEQTETTIRLSQPILTGGKIAKRTRIAELRQDLAAWDYEAARLDVFTQVVQRYVNVLAAKRRVNVAEQTFGLAEQVLDTVSQQVEAGEVSSIERRRATVELSEARIALQQAQRTRTSARAALAGAIGLKQASFGEVAGELEPVGDVPPLETLARHVEQNPAIVRWGTEFEQRKAQVELAEAESIPDVTVSAGLQRFNERDDYAGLVSVGLPLPIFDRNRGGILEARFDLAKARSQREAAVVRIRTDLAQAHEDLQAARDELQILESETLPAARSAYRDIRITYRQGERPLLDVLDAQRTLFSLEARQVEALAAYHRAAARIERLTGETLESLAAAPEAEAPTTPTTQPAPNN